jgi:hypothetical protein
MKRLVYVPFCALQDGEIPDNALALAKETRLAIRIGEEGEKGESDVCVVQVPEKNQIDFKSTVKVGFIQSIDYTNEFIVFSHDLKCEVTKNGVFGSGDSIFLTPVLRESHMVKYRDRFSEAGVYDFSISTTANGVLCKGSFEVL